MSQCALRTSSGVRLHSPTCFLVRVSLALFHVMSTPGKLACNLHRGLLPQLPTLSKDTGIIDDTSQACVADDWTR